MSDETPKTALLQTITGVMPSFFKIFEVDKERALKGDAANVSVVVSVLYSNKINAFDKKIYLEVLFGLALEKVCFTRRFVVVLNSQQINYLFSLYSVH